VATPAEIVTAIDAAVLQIVQDGATEVEVNGQRFRSQDLDKLRLLRSEYEHLADRDAARAAGRGRGPVIQFYR
jgi:hypothetical protein